MCGREAYDWDDGNARKNEQHGVPMAEAEQVFFNSPLLVLSAAKHRLDRAVSNIFLAVRLAHIDKREYGDGLVTGHAHCSGRRLLCGDQSAVATSLRMHRLRCTGGRIH